VAGSKTITATFHSTVDSCTFAYFMLANASQTPPSPFDVSTNNLSGGTPYASTDPATIVGWNGNNNDVLVQVDADDVGILLAHLFSKTSSDTGTGSWTADSSQILHGQAETSGGTDVFSLYDSKVITGAGAKDMDVGVTGGPVGARFATRAVVNWAEAAALGDPSSFFGRIRRAA
jgi:hypothetical protein